MLVPHESARYLIGSRGTQRKKRNSWRERISFSPYTVASGLLWDQSPSKRQHGFKSTKYQGYRKWKFFGVGTRVLGFSFFPVQPRLSHRCERSCGAVWWQDHWDRPSSTTSPHCCCRVRAPCGEQKRRYVETNKRKCTGALNKWNERTHKKNGRGHNLRRPNPNLEIYFWFLSLSLSLSQASGSASFSFWWFSGR